MEITLDDILVLAPTRWKLRRAVRMLSQILSSLYLEKHPEKTFIGRIEKSLDSFGLPLQPSRADRGPKDA